MQKQITSDGPFHIQPQFSQLFWLRSAYSHRRPAFRDKLLNRTTIRLRGGFIHARCGIHLEDIASSALIFEKINCPPQIIKGPDGAPCQLDADAGWLEVMVIYITGLRVPYGKTIVSFLRRVWIEPPQALLDVLVVKNMD